MIRTLKIIVAAFVLLTLFCGKKQTIKAPTGDQLLWSSESPRPSWGYEEPYVSEGIQYFVGLSHKYADEKGARDDAERESRLRAVRYLETAAKETFERIVSELGLESGVFNPSVAARGYTEMVSQAVVQQTKVVKFYAEQWKSASTGEVYYRTFAKLLLPDEQVMESFNDYTKRKQTEWNMAQDQIDRVNDVFQQHWESKKAEQELKEEVEE